MRRGRVLCLREQRAELGLRGGGYAWSHSESKSGVVSRAGVQWRGRVPSLISSMRSAEINGLPSAYTEWATDDDGTPRLECNSAWMMLYPVKAAFAESAAGDLMGSNGFEPAAPASIILAWAVRIRT